MPVVSSCEQQRLPREEKGTGNGERGTHCCTPGAASRKPPEPRWSFTSLTMLLAARRHFSVLTFVIGFEAERRRKNLQVAGEEWGD